MFQFAFRTKNPLMLQAAEKWAGISGYYLDQNELHAYSRTKNFIKNNECKFFILGCILTVDRLEGKVFGWS